MTTVTRAILERHSARAFLNKSIPLSIVREIIEIARHTASSSNMQPWRVTAMAGSDLEQLKAAVKQSLAANSAGEGSEYNIYAAHLKDPYNSRRLKCAEDMYATIGIGKENKLGRLMQFARNFDFYGAPVGMILSIDRAMEQGQWADTGMFLQSILLLAHERGLAACPQAAWAAMHKTVRAHLDLPPELIVFCGISLGYRDASQPINSLVTERASLEEIADLRGFALEELNRPAPVSP
ncbi:MULTISPECIES: nitroreductase [unclassified Bradyrhizobium]|uniref:nitroreductase n=1 Tax=unclassified Bradyrhizobium TaxID=2631580 RepID=UPI0004183351|nr:MULTISPECIES: nitroreductase [unclassified Bradyrhizobium]MCP3462789.1 nitroreductase [Bradyrhizobium sp. CCGUVB23]